MPKLLTFLLTRPLRDVTETAEQPQPETAISTHTPLAGRDPYARIIPFATLISTHTPLAGRDHL